VAISLGGRQKRNLVLLFGVRRKNRFLKQNHFRKQKNGGNEHPSQRFSMYDELLLGGAYKLFKATRTAQKGRKDLQCIDERRRMI